MEVSVSQLSNDFHNRIIQWLNVAIQLIIKIHKTTIYPVVLVMNTNKDTIYPLFSRSAKRGVSLQGTNTAVGCFRTKCLPNSWTNDRKQQEYGEKYLIMYFLIFILM
jgi:hypothetical protein